MPGHHTVPEIVRLVRPGFCRPGFHKRVEFDERGRVNQEIDPFAGRQLSDLVLAIDSRLTATHDGFGAHLGESVQTLGVRWHDSSPVRLVDAITKERSHLSLRKDTAQIDR